MRLEYDVFETRFGWMGLEASSKGLRHTTLPRTSPDECISELYGDSHIATESGTGFHDLEDKLISYFEGHPVDFTEEAIDITDSPPFHQAAWIACRSIPVGETRPYKWLAIKAGNSRAVRAAGLAMARNRRPIIIPCLRVVASDGRLRGFGRESGQLGLKQQLLDLES